jgi:hypothetical protein
MQVNRLSGQVADLTNRYVAPPVPGDGDGVGGPDGEPPGAPDDAGDAAGLDGAADAVGLDGAADEGPGSCAGSRVKPGAVPHAATRATPETSPTVATILARRSAVRRDASSERTDAA